MAFVFNESDFLLSFYRKKIIESRQKFKKECNIFDTNDFNKASEERRISQSEAALQFSNSFNEENCSEKLSQMNSKEIVDFLIILGKYNVKCGLIIKKLTYDQKMLFYGATLKGLL